MNKIFWTLSVSLLTFGLLFGFSLCASQVTAAEDDGAAAATADAGVKKTILLCSKDQSFLSTM